MDAPAQSLTTLVYNIAAFSPDAAELGDRVRKAFPQARIAFAPDARRQAIVDSWPEDVDDARARRDWGFRPGYGLERAFDEYLLPEVKRHYVRG
jgi:threonine 3-dehydrogenase